MRTNIKQKNNVCLAGSVLLLLTIIVIGCVYLDRVSVNQAPEQKRSDILGKGRRNRNFYNGGTYCVCRRPWKCTVYCGFIGS